MNPRDAASQLACVIFDAGGAAPVAALHPLFEDAVPDAGGWMMSKTACDALSVMLKTGMATIGGGDFYTVKVDPGLVTVLRGINETVKTAQEETATVLRRLCDTLPPLLSKYAAEAAAALDRPPEYDQAAELELWKSWKQSGDKTHLSELLRRYTPLLKKSASPFYAAPLPKTTIDAEATNVAIQAFENFDPMKGVKLSTYVTSYMPQVRRFVIEHQNVARIPEEQALKIGRFKEAERDLASKHGRAASSHELADHLGWHPHDVGKMRRMQRADIVSENQSEPLGRMETPPIEKANVLVDYMHHEMAGPDKVVFEHLYGLDGAPKLDTTEHIAKHTGMSVAQVNKSRTRIADKAMESMDYIP